MKALPKPLFNRNFQLLLACNVISLIGSAIAVVAVPFAVLAVGGSAGDVGYVAAAALIAFIACLLLGGVVADRLPRNKVMIAANVLQAAAQAASAAVVMSGSGTVWELLGLATIRGAGLGFYFPAETGILPQTVPEDQRAEANAMAAYSTGSVIGAITMIRLRPRRIILAATLAVPGTSFLLFALAFPLAVPLLAVAALVAGACLGVFDVNWVTTLQQEIPLAALSRVSAYDTLGSAALIPVSSAAAGPLADHFGPSLVLTVGGTIIVILTAAVLALPEVRQLRRQVDPERGPLGAA